MKFWRIVDFIRKNDKFIAYIPKIQQFTVMQSTVGNFSKVKTRFKISIFKLRWSNTPKKNPKLLCKHRLSLSKNVSLANKQNFVSKLFWRILAIKNLLILTFQIKKVCGSHTKNFQQPQNFNWITVSAHKKNRHTIAKKTAMNNNKRKHHTPLSLTITISYHPPRCVVFKEKKYKPRCLGRDRDSAALLLLGWLRVTFRTVSRILYSVATRRE